MEQVIYIDILIITNLIINFFLILITSKFMYLKINYIRLIFGEILGAIYSLYILLPDYNFIISFITKLLMSVSIILITFEIKNIKLFIKVLICFYLTNFCFSGLVFILWFNFRPKNIIINNGIIYFDISPVVLIFSVLISYLILELINYIFDKNQRQNNLLLQEICIKSNNKLIKLIGKIDTGNNLKEPFSQLPVIIIRKNSVKNILPENFDNFLEINNFNNNTNIQNLKNIRFVPYRTVSNEGILPAFKPDSVILKNSPKQAYIAVCSDEFLSPDVPVLINPVLLD